MDQDQKEKLISTLVSNGLAASRSEALRMADEMLRTSAKVNEGMKADTNTSMVKDYELKKKEAEPQPAPAAPAQTTSAAPSNFTSSSSDPRQAKIEELRASAINPQPVNVQTNYDTPASQTAPEAETPAQPEAPVSESAPVDFTAEPEGHESPTAQLSQEEQSQEAPVAQEPAPVEQSESQPQMTPEEYAAQQMGGGLGGQSIGGFTESAPAEAPQEQPAADPAHFEAPAEPVGEVTPERVSEPEPVTQTQEPISEAPAPNNDFIAPTPAPVEQEASQEAAPVAEVNEPITQSPEPTEQPLGGLESTPPPMPEMQPVDAVAQAPEPSTAPTPEMPVQAPEQPGEAPQTAPEAPQQGESSQEEQPAEKKKGTWTEEDEKLAKDVDLSKVFNYSDKQ